MIYVDKTEIIFNLLKNNSTTISLAPSSFGKTIFLNTVECFFEQKLAWWIKYAPELWITQHMKKETNYDNQEE